MFDTKKFILYVYVIVISKGVVAIWLEEIKVMHALCW